MSPLRFLVLIVFFMSVCPAWADLVQVKKELKRAQGCLKHFTKVELNLIKQREWETYVGALSHLKKAKAYKKVKQYERDFYKDLWTGVIAASKDAKLKQISVPGIVDVIRHADTQKYQCSPGLKLTPISITPYARGSSSVQFECGNDSDLFVDFGEGIYRSGSTTAHKRIRLFPDWTVYLRGQVKDKTRKDAHERFQNALQMLSKITQFSDQEKDFLPFPKFIGPDHYIHLKLDFDLVDLLQQDKPPSSKDRALLFQQILQAVVTLHKKGIFVGDLKPENILIQQYVDQNKTVRYRPIVSDFDGSAIPRVLLEKKEFGGRVRSLTGGYASWERFLGGERGVFGDSLDIRAENVLKADVFSLGVIALNLWDIEVPWESCDLSYGSIKYLNCFKESLTGFFDKAALTTGYSRRFETVLAALRSSPSKRIDSETFLNFWKDSGQREPGPISSGKKEALLEEFKEQGIEDLTDWDDAEDRLTNDPIGAYVLFPVKNQDESQYYLGLAYVAEAEPGFTVVNVRELNVDLPSPANASERRSVVLKELEFLKGLGTLVKNVGLN